MPPLDAFYVLRTLFRFTHSTDCKICSCTSSVCFLVFGIMSLHMDVKSTWAWNQSVFDGLNLFAYGLVCTSAISGLLISFTLKYLDNVAKCFCALYAVRCVLGFRDETTNDPSASSAGHHFNHVSCRTIRERGRISVRKVTSRLFTPKLRTMKDARPTAVRR